MVAIQTKLTGKDFLKIIFFFSPVSVIVIPIVIIGPTFYKHIMHPVIDDPMVNIWTTVILFIGIPCFMIFSFKRALKKKPQAFQNLTYYFSEHEIIIKGETFETKINWSQFKKVEVVKGWVMLQRGFIANYFRVNAFSSEGEFATFLSYARQNGLKVKA